MQCERVLYIDSVLSDLYTTCSGIEISQKMLNILKCVEPIFFKLSGFLAIPVWGPHVKIMTIVFQNIKGVVRIFFLTPNFGLGAENFFQPLELLGPS